MIVDIMLWIICICISAVAIVIAGFVLVSVIRGMILAKEDTELYRRNRLEKENEYRKQKLREKEKKD